MGGIEISTSLFFSLFCITQVSKQDISGGMTRILGTVTSTQGSFQMAYTTGILTSSTAAVQMGMPPMPLSHLLTRPSWCWSSTPICASWSKEWKWEVSTSTGIAKTGFLKTELVVPGLTPMWATTSRLNNVIIITSVHVIELKWLNMPNKKLTSQWSMKIAKHCNLIETYCSKLYWFLNYK